MKLRMLLIPTLALALTAPAAVQAQQKPTTCEAATDMDIAPVIAVNVRGTGQREASAPNRFVRTVGLYSMTGEKLGTATRDVAFTGPNTADDIMTFRFRDGELVSRAVSSVSPASSDPGFVYVATHPRGDTILPERGTGPYAGRTGRLRMAGWHDGRAFPERATFDDFFVIELDPKR